jgi:plastocyanin
MGSIAATALVLIALIATAGTVGITQVVTGHSQIASSTTTVTTTSSDPNALPQGVVNQTPQHRHFVVDWSNTGSSGQDRFNPPSITVNQGDTMDITFLANDTDAHTFTVGAPYNYQINDTVPGTRNFLTNQNFTTNATGNSPGVVVTGTPGNITGRGSFVAKYAGIYEYFCVYHVSLGMFGYLIVLPNVAYNGSSTVSSPNGPNKNVNQSGSTISIEQGSAINSTSAYYSPATITVVLGVNNTVSWTNDDFAPHTITSDSGLFLSGNLNSGQSYSFTFLTTGTYTYHCSYHPWMHGTIVVKAAS